jgi:hypothetical protein
MLQPLPPHKVKRIITNIIKTIKSGDIEKLEKQSYNYLYLCSGFIAHYNWYGFKDYYLDTETLKHDILSNISNNQWRNFRPTDENYEYYHQKAVIYNEICIGL